MFPKKRGLNTSGKTTNNENQGFLLKRNDSFFRPKFHTRLMSRPRASGVLTDTEFQPNRCIFSSAWVEFRFGAENENGSRFRRFDWDVFGKGHKTDRNRDLI